MPNNDTGDPLQREPALGVVEAGQCERVRAHIASAIAAAGGWIGFETYMDLALYAPGLGYYSAGAHKLGPGGDFTTAPETSRLFGACVARQCAEVLAAVGGEVVEGGAGSGRLAADVLLRLEQLHMLPPRYSILEVSADLRERQRRHLGESVPHLASRVAWLDAPPAPPFDGVVIANEVLDALPVARFRWNPRDVVELGVTERDGRFAWEPAPARPGMGETVRSLASAAGGGWEPGYVSEYCPRLAVWAGEVTRGLRAGAVLWFDYGMVRRQYYLPERHDGTLICHFRHRPHLDPFALPGLADITAWVDFTALAEAGARAGFEIGGFTSQGYFLAGNGIDGEMRLLAGDDSQAAARLAQEARQLMMTGDMGERFKAMAWLRGVDLELAGFALRDMRHTL